MQIRKICIKSIAVLMAAIVMVSTPLSRFADTKGVSETHAVAPALITLGGLFGAIAGAYGLYVAVDKLGDYAENWFNWTADNATDARTDLQKIKDGVTGYVITKAVTKSVADFLASKVSDDYSYTVQGVADTSKNILGSGVETSVYDEFMLNLLSDTPQFLKGEIPFLVSWSSSSVYSSGVFSVYYFFGSALNYLKNKNGFSDYLIYSNSPEDGQNFFHIAGFDSQGGFVGKESMFYRKSFYIENGSWQSSSYVAYNNTPLLDGIIGDYYEFVHPVYRTTFSTHSDVRSYQDYIDNAVYNKRITVDYKTHGNNALDNTNALEGAEVTQAQLEAIQQAVEKEYSNVVQFPNSGGDNEEEPDTQALANAITLAVLSTLQNMGYIKNPTDEPSGENVKEQLGNIQISLDGLIDAISQINPAQGLANIAQGIAELPQKITASVTDAIRNVFEDLFVPDEGAIQDKVDEITDKFAFADSLLTVVDDIDSALKNASGPPEIYIHFEDAEDSKYTPIGTLKLLSFEWYERYKPYGDALLSSMLWLFFLWKVRKRIAEIVQGLSVSGESDTNASANSAIGIERGRSS